MIYRNLATGRIEPLPWRVRLADGTTRTDPEQWASDREALAAAGYEQTTRTPADDAMDAATALDAARAAKLMEIDAAWQSMVDSGWTPPGEAFALGIDVADVTLLLGAYTLAKDAAAMGLPGEVSIIDKNGGQHLYTAQTLTPIMLQYGAARAAMSAGDAQLRRAVSAAQAADEVSAIAVP